MIKKFLLALAIILVACAAVFTSCGKLSEDTDHEHSYLERTFDPKCTEDGRHEKICIICNDVVLLEVLPAKGHALNDWQTKAEPSCISGKSEERVCMDCGAVVETKVGPALGHTLGEWQVVKDATCSQNLIEEKICKTCGIVAETRTGEKIIHEYVQAEIKGTCAVGAHILHTCRFCGDSYSSNFSEVREEHIEGDWIVESAPTCHADGIRKKICSVCSTGLRFEPIAMDPDNHSFTVESVAPEGDNPGYTKYTCKLCQYELTNAYESNYLPSQIYEMAVNSTVRIEARNKDGKMHSLGSGFFITEDGQIATNYHVIAGAYSLKVKLYSGVEYDVVKVKGYDILKDIAVIQIDAQGTQALRIAAEAPKTGDPVYTLGSPLGIDDVFTDGVVSNPDKLLNGKHVIVFSAPIAAGNSGGPLLNARGEVVGINTEVALDGQNLNFAILGSVVTDLDKSGEKTVYETYIECMNISGVNSLAYYIMLNGKQDKENETYTITKTVQAEGSSYGRNCRFIYNAKLSSVIVSVDWISGGRLIYSIELFINGIKDEYEIKMFDHTWSQYTAEGKITTKHQAVSNEGTLDTALLNKIFTFSYVNYPASKGDPLTVESAKKLIGMAYIHMLEKLEVLLAESNTELTLEIFKLQPVSIPEPTPEE